MVDLRTDLTAQLIRAGADTGDGVDALVARAGLDEVATALVDEVMFRCPPATNTMPIHLSLEIEHGDRTHRSVLRVVRDEPVTLADPATVCWSHLRFRASALLRRLFGPPDGPRYGDFHNSFVPAPADRGALDALFEQLDELMHAAAQATHTVISGCTARSPELGELSIRYGSDKWASFHWYTPHYERHFAPLRDRPVRLLEIGIGGYEADLGGSSLKMWKRYFHRGLIYGLDLHDKSALNESRLTALTGDQSDPRGLIELAKRYGPFDIVIDDGSHVNEHVHTSFGVLFPYVRDGGLYVIEDLQTSYFEDFGGVPGGTAAPHTSLGLVKRLVDDLHHVEYAKTTDRPPTLTQATVTGLHVYHNIAFVEKGVNGEDTLPAWMDANAWDALGAQ